TQNADLMPVQDIVSRFKDLKKDSSKVSLSGIIGPRVVDDTYCEQTYPGTRYYSAIDLLRGVAADICQTDYSTVMDQLGLVASGILTTFQLSKAAVVESIVVTVTPAGGAPKEVKQDATNGWTYLEDYARIQFNGDAVPERGAHIEVEYEVAGPVPDPPEETTP
ncbi:MAG TPA: hypothetical protein PLA94_32985, partial [Myxococcota bacterium]|nr:hypothetical protein [Myxococcota bacterium]